MLKKKWWFIRALKHWSDMVDKKECHGLYFKEETLAKQNNEREKETTLCSILKKKVLNGSDDIKKIEEVYRLGKYDGNARPMYIKIRSQVDVNDVMKRTWKLAGVV